jgi:tetratricopeptide (TPR) repeat protein
LADNSLTTVDVDYNFTVRSSDVTSQLSKAQIALNSGQFTLEDQHLDAAIFNTSQLDSIAITNIYFYKGIVSLKKPNYSIAIENFSLVANYNNSILRKDAIWLRGLAYIKVENFEAAKKDFQYIQKSTGWTKAKEASKILESLDTK